MRSSAIAPERAEVNLVLVDTLVRTRDGKPARGLTKDDFELQIDRLPAPIATFENRCLEGGPPGGAAPPSAPVGTATGAEGPAEPRHIVLFFDISHLTRAGRDHSFDAAEKFVREAMSPSDRVMLIAYKGRPILLEPFTSDRSRLAERLAAAKRDDSLLDTSTIEQTVNMRDVLRRDCGGVDSCPQRVTAAVAYAQEEEDSARRSLNVLKALMPALAGLRGRKTLVHFSETLKDEPGLQYLILASTTPQREKIDIHNIIQDLTREANSAGVSFYMVFAGGLGQGSGAGTSDAAITGISSEDTSLMLRANQGAEDGALGLESTLAAETGGNASRRTNDLGKIFTSVEEDLSCYYVLGYSNPGPGDGQRHSIIVKVKSKGYEVRHRPYYEDLSDDERLERKFRSALLAPAYYRAVSVTTEAYALAPTDKSLPFLIKAEIPLSAVTLVGGPDGRRTGQIEIRGTVWTGSKETVRFARKLAIALEAGEEVGSRKVIYETGSEVPPGSHLLTVAVEESGSGEIGAAEIEMPVRERAAGVAGDVLLWTSSGSDLLFAGDAASVGIHDSGSGHGFVPRSERRFGTREAGVLYVIVCPPRRGASSPPNPPVEVRRSIFADDLEVATFPPVTLDGTASGGAAGAGAGPASKDRTATGAAPDGSAPAAAGSGAAAEAPRNDRSNAAACEGIFAPIPPGRLGPGGYTYQVQVTGLGPDPIIRRAGFLVEEAPARTPGS